MDTQSYVVRRFLIAVWIKGLEQRSMREDAHGLGAALVNNEHQYLLRYWVNWIRGDRDVLTPQHGYQ